MIFVANTIEQFSAESQRENINHQKQMVMELRIHKFESEKIVIEETSVLNTYLGTDITSSDILKTGTNKALMTVRYMQSGRINT